MKMRLALIYTLHENGNLENTFMKKRIALLFSALFSLALSSCSQTSAPMYNGSAEALICQEADLPGEYLLLEDLSGARPNEELTIDPENPQESEQYIEATGRLEGWENRFMLTEPTQTLPGYVLCQVVKFTSAEGANEALLWPSSEQREVIETERQLGEGLIVTQSLFEAPDGSLWMDYRVEFTYQNLLGAVSTYAPQSIATPDYALDIAEILFQRFQHPSTVSGTPSP